jgi:hypothetical protein
MAVAPLIDNAPFDARKLTWLGSISTDVSVCMTWYASPIKTFDDMLATPFTMAGLGGGADPDIFALMLRNMFGAKLKLVSGYPAPMTERRHGTRRGQRHVRTGAEHGQGAAHGLGEAKKINLPIQFGLKGGRHPRRSRAWISRATSRPRWRGSSSRTGDGAPHAAPPNIPEDRKKALMPLRPP